MLKGLGYALAVCHANAVVSDYVRGEADEMTGLLPDEVSLPAGSDPWQGGGVWRAEHPGSAYARVDVTQPLGLGWRSNLPAQMPPTPGSEALTEPTHGQSQEPTPEPEQVLTDAEDSEDGTMPSVTDSQVSWTWPLRLSHQIDGRLPLPEQVVAHTCGRVVAQRGCGSSSRMTATSSTGVRQAQQNTDTDLHGAQPQLGGIDWPLEFFPSIVLTCTWPRGGGVVRATSTLLDVPVTADGMEIEHRYDASILTRDHAPGEARRSVGTGHRQLNRSIWDAHALAAGVAGSAPA